jgi:hypothetical protein
MCQALGEPKLALLLREPVDRTYSAFLEFEDNFLPSTSSVNDKRTSSVWPDIFDTVARADMAIFQACGGVASRRSSGAEGVTYGDVRFTAQRTSFSRCCAAVVTNLSLPRSPWPGCECTPHLSSYHKSTHYRSEYGDLRYAPVRQSIYLPQLQNVLTSHRVENVLLFRSEDYFNNTVSVASEMIGLAAAPDPSALSEYVTTHRAEELKLGSTRAAVNTQQGRSPSMLNTTQAVLQTFFGLRPAQRRPLDICGTTTAVGVLREERSPQTERPLVLIV